MAARRCPQCGAEVKGDAAGFRPFCSERCKLVDLGNWLGERYRIPGQTPEPEAPDEPEDS